MQAYLIFQESFGSSRIILAVHSWTEIARNPSGLDMAWKETGPLEKSEIQTQITCFPPLFYDFSMTKKKKKILKDIQNVKLKRIENK